MSLQQFLGILFARKWMIAAALLASLLGALIVIVLVPPRYTASSRLMLDIVKPDPVTGQVLANQFVRAYTKTQTELIRDYQVAGRVVDELGWTRDPNMLARYQIGADAEDARRRMAQVIIDRTEARLIEGSNILEITYTAWTPDAAKSVADSLRRAYFDVTVAIKQKSAAESADWYEIQNDKARRLLSMAERAKGEFERKNGLIMQADDTDVDSARLAALSGSSDVPVSASAPPVGTSSAASAELARVSAQIAQLSQTLGANHPTMRQLQQQRATLSAQVSQDRAAAASAASSANRAAASAAGATRQAYEAQKARVIASREKLAELKQLQDEVNLRRDQYNKAATKAAELRLQAEVADAGLTMLGNAVAPERPSFPNKPLILFGALAFGVALGVVAALLTELLNRRVRSGRDLQDAALKVPLLAIVGSSPRGTAFAPLAWIRDRLPRRRSEEALAV